ncbi:unnamed protein product [Phaedon cochleariae]|uniref:Cyclic nucleotide-binding domain-containing protein n=1 Tax=Phaedon cochleariae TaxID=80249 RepID=A0A9P0DPM5_PHACE|nr:unnamed protein product [Phaedon cochleariae]
MPHQCTIEPTKLNNGKSDSSWLKSKWLSLVVISADNPLCSLYFRSETGVRAEKMKQLCSKHPYIIHPMSKFRRWYDVCILFIYILMLLVKPIDGSIGRHQSMDDLFANYREFSLSLDFVSWINIFLHFGMGCTDARNKVIEMRPSKIARKYLSSPYFIVDILSSLPRYLPYYWNEGTQNKIIMGCLNICCMLKLFRIFTVIKLISKVSYSFHIKSSMAVFMTSAITGCLYILHLSTCLLMAVPRLVQYHFGGESLDWLREHYGENYRKKYIMAVFRSSACLLGIRYDLEENKYVEDYLITIATYVVGKILIATTWVVLAVAILNSRSMNIKYQEIINQLNEYMIQKQLPIELRHRISQFYAFKYQSRYFKEELINSLLSDKLRKDINLHVCRSLIENVSLFADLPSNQVSDVVALLVPEIFLARDTIIQSGTNGDSMYFLSSGTVAVYTHSGKEVCHLQDGAYFGEISLVLKDQARTATIIAIEVTQVYRLKKKDFEKTLVKNRPVYQSIIHRAEMRLKETLQLEESYKMALFEKTYTKQSVAVPSRSVSYVSSSGPGNPMNIVPSTYMKK